MSRILLAAQGHPPRRHLPPWLRHGWRRYVHTFTPRYDPSCLDPNPLVDVVLATL